MSEKEEKIISRLKELYPDAECSLEYASDPFRLLVSARLSAQCTDERVNMVTPRLFEKYPDVRAMARADVSDIEDIVRSCGLYKMKAKNIRDMSEDIVSIYGGRVPGNMDDLLKLPGVGRKIANLVLGDVFGAGGIVADTHCIRICGRLGYYPEDKKDPLLTERTMEKVIPRQEQSGFCHRIVMFGREYCMARNPSCSACPLADICDHHKKEVKNDV